MEINYKIDIFEKLVEFLALVYFVFGFFTTYSWACKELDKISNDSDIKVFWEPVAGVYSVMNLINIAAVIYCITMNRKYCLNEPPANRENNLLFHILCTPLFFITVVYLGWNFINNCMISLTNGTMSIFMTFTEMLLFIAAMSLILNVNKSRRGPQDMFHHQRNSLVLLVTLIGVVNYFLYHMTGQQIDNFVETASNFPAYNKYYNKTNINRVEDNIYFKKVREYVQPLVILFSCCCLAYLVTLLYRTNNNRKEIDDNVDDQDQSRFQSEMTSRAQSEDNLLLPLDNVANTPPFRLPPVSLLLGILFITITILILVIVVSLTTSGTLSYLQEKGQETFTLFPILVYIVSIVLLCIQINDMERWPKLEKNKNIVDKALVWIGASGQLIVSLAQIKLISDQITFNHNDSQFLFCSIIVVYLLLMFQTLFQSLTIFLALDRIWMPPAIQTWQEYICPPVGMLSINIGLFLFSVYAVKNDASMVNFTIPPNDTQLFLKIFGSGFNSIGETLAILSRLHSSLIFGKMIAFTNKR